MALSFKKKQSAADEAVEKTAVEAVGEHSAKRAPSFGPKSAWGRLVEWQRLAIQIVFLILAPQTFSLAFSGVKQLFAAIGKLDTFDANSFVILLVLLVVFTVVFGRFFCGYICAFGTIGDILYKIVDFPLRKLHIKRPRLPRGVENALRCLKYVVLAFFVVTSVAGLSSMVSVYSPWTAFGRLLALNISDLNVVGLALLVVIAIGMICKERFFCEFLCPMGAVFSLLPVLPFSSMRRHLPSCDNCGACERQCPVAIMPDGDSAIMGECISCGRCETTCPHGAIGQCSAATLAQRLESDFPAANEGAESAAKVSSAPTKGGSEESLTTKAHTVRAIALAVVLLVVFWALNAVNFIPTPW